jgi:hypothetical protein
MNVYIYTSTTMFGWDKKGATPYCTYRYNQYPNVLHPSRNDIWKTFAVASALYILTECNQQKQGRSVAVVVLFVLMLWRSLQYLAGPARISKVGIIEPYVNQISYKDQNTMKQYIYKRKKGRSNQPGTKEVSENKGLTLVDRL